MISRDQWFDRTGNVQSHHQESKDKGGGKTMDSDADASVSVTKKLVGAYYTGVNK